MVKKYLIILSLAFMANSCSDDIAVLLGDQGKTTVVESLDQLSASDGDSVQVSGKNLTTDIEVFVNDLPATLSLNGDGKSASFVMPSNAGQGLLNVVFKLKKKVIAKFPMINGASTDSMPMQAISAENICDGFIFKNASGKLEKGTRACAETLADCTRDGQIDCLATEDFPVVLTSDLAPKITFGESLAGISSSAAEVCNIDAIHRLSALADGTIMICVIGKDSLGTWQAEASATTASWTKDVTPPVAMISGQPTGTNNTTSLSVTVAGTGVSHYKYKARVPADVACSDAAGYSAEVAVGTLVTSSVSALSDGVLQLCVIGRDTAGNWQSEASAANASWTKDTTLPVAALSGEPTGTNNATSLNVTVAGTDVSEYKYKVRDTADAACSVSNGYSAAISVATPITSSISALVDGAVQLCVIGKDSAGNWQLEGTATIASWTKDTTPSTASIANAPTGTNNATTLDVTIAGTDITQYKYKLRVPADAACSLATGYSSAIAVGTHITDSISALADGTISLCVIGKDSSGNWQTEATATIVSWIKDVSAPVATFSGEPSGTNNTTALSVTVAGTGVSHYKYKVRVPADVACSNATGYSAEIAVAALITSSVSALADGVLQLCVIGRDAAGNWQTEATAANASWTKDATLPSATLSGQPTGTNNAVTLNVTVAGTDVVQYKYKIRVATDTACSNSTGYSAAIVVATPITDSISGLADGAIQLCVIGKDTAGNWQLEGTATIASWTKDVTPPVATIANEPTGTNSTTVLDVTIAGTDVTQYIYKVRVPADAACSVNTGYSTATAVATHVTASVTALADGLLQLCVIGKDTAGNWQTEATATTVSWTKDTTAPVATLSGAPTGTNNTTALSVIVAGTGVSHYKYKVRVPADVACSNATGYSAEIAVATLITSSVSALADGVLQLCVIGRDTTGNWQTEATATAASWTKDTVLPAGHGWQLATRRHGNGRLLDERYGRSDRHD